MLPLNNATGRPLNLDNGITNSLRLLAASTFALFRQKNRGITLTITLTLTITITITITTTITITITITITAR